MSIRFRMIAAAILSALTLIGFAPSASAAQANDKWIVRTAIQSAWNQQSYSDQIDICLGFLEMPNYWAGEFAETATEGTDVSWYWAKRYIKRFFYSRCSSLV